MTDREALLYNCQREDGPIWLLVAADWFCEHDEPDVERALRWMAKWERRPHTLINQTNCETGRVWMWTCFGGIREGLPHATLPRKLCERLQFWEWRCYETWEQAVVALGRALVTGDVDCVGDPFQCDAESLEMIDRHAQEVRAAMADLEAP